MREGGWGAAAPRQTRPEKQKGGRRCEPLSRAAQRRRARRGRAGSRLAPLPSGRECDPAAGKGGLAGEEVDGGGCDAWRGGQHARGQVRAHRRSGSDFCSSGCRVMVSRTSLRSDAAGSAADSAFSGKCFLQRPDRSTRGHGRQGTSSFGLLQSSKQVCI